MFILYPLASAGQILLVGMLVTRCRRGEAGKYLQAACTGIIGGEGKGLMSCKAQRHEHEWSRWRLPCIFQ
jgi:hypothetical protein